MPNLFQLMADVLDTRPRHSNPDVDELLKFQAQAEPCQEEGCDGRNARRCPDGLKRCFPCTEKKIARELAEGRQVPA